MKKSACYFRVPMSTLIKCEQVLEKIQFGTKIVSIGTYFAHINSVFPIADACN